MARTYRGNGLWGTGKGSNLTEAEFDNNTYTDQLAIQTLIDNPPEAVSIDDFQVVGSQMTVVMTDATERGPFSLPVSRLRFRGAWAPATAYLDTDIVSVASLGLYAVLQDHTSAGSFDPEASNSAGDFYQLVFPINVPAPVRAPVTGTSFTPELSDASKYIRCTSNIGCTVILPSDFFEDGAELHFRQASTGAITFTVDSGGIIDPPDGDDVTSARRGAVVTCKWIALTGTWEIFGDLLSVSA